MPCLGKEGRLERTESGTGKGSDPSGFSLVQGSPHRPGQLGWWKGFREVCETWNKTFPGLSEVLAVAAGEDDPEHRLLGPCAARSPAWIRIL